MRIEICGGIASGKTTFANLIQNAGVKCELENFIQNPFWEPFYKNPGKYIFETEITFLLQHYHAIKKSLQKNSLIICDFSLYIDLAYAKIGLTDSRLDIFKIIHKEIVAEIGVPLLVVHLICDPRIQYDRIMQRARLVEKSINIEFLDRLNKAIAHEIDKLNNSVKVITVNSGKENFLTKKDTKKELISIVKDSISNLVAPK